jgi:two-component system sensor histidine kinase YesM
LRSIRSKILVSILLITVLTASMITSIFYRKSAETIEENYISSNQQRNRQLMEGLDQNMQEVYRVLAETATDGVIKQRVRQYANKPQDDILVQIADILKSYNKQNKAISSFYLFIPDEQVLVTSEDYPTYRKVIEKRSIDAIIKNGVGKPGPFLLTNLISGEAPHLAFVESVIDEETGVSKAYICANIEERSLYYNYISEMKNDTVKAVMLLERHNKVITADAVDPKQEVAIGSYIKTPEMNSTEKVTTVDDKIYFYSRASFSGCTLFISVDRNAVLGSLKETQIYYLGILLVSLFPAAVLAVYLARLIYRPVQKLTNTVKQVAEGELDIRAEVAAKDEIGTLSVEFNQMLDHIEALIKQLIAEEKLKQDAELEALQYQVTPHFMYNTLNSIKYAALIKGEKELAGLIENFVELLQASISKKGAFLQVTDEVYILQNYVRLQEFRSNATIHMKCDIAEEAQRCLIPRLLLQPLAENSLLHGIDLKEDRGVLEVNARVKEDMLYLEVADNGRGISQQKIVELMNSQVKNTKGFSAIGVPNVRERLRLYYGKQAGMEFISSSQGTRVIIHLPAEYERGEENR